MTDIGGLDFEASFVVKDEGIVDRVIEKHESFIEEMQDPRDIQMWEKEVLRKHRDHEVMVEYPFWTHNMHVRLNPQESDKVYIKIYQNIPMKTFSDNWNEFASEILGIESAEEFTDLEKDYLDDVRKSVKTIEDFVGK
jgi:hypothetical protein